MPGRKNKLSDLRDHLFSTLEGLADEEEPLNIKRAKAICEVAQTIINSAKVEVDMVRALAQSPVDPSTFFEQHPDKMLEAADIKSHFASMADRGSAREHKGTTSLGGSKLHVCDSQSDDRTSAMRSDSAFAAVPGPRAHRTD